MARGNCYRQQSSEGHLHTSHVVMSVLGVRVSVPIILDGYSRTAVHRTFLQPQTSPWPQPSRLAGPTSEGWQVMRASHAAADARIVPAVTSSTIHPVTD